MARTDDVVDGVRRMILRGDLRPGDRLPVEKELAAQLGVSRGSLREGVRALTLMGVLDTRQGAGTFVTSLEPGVLLASVGYAADLRRHDALHFLGVRRVLEAEAAALAAPRIDGEALDRAGRLLADAESMLGEGGGEPDHEGLLVKDLAFHRIVVDAAGNPVLAALLEAFAGQTWRARVWRSVSDGDALRRTVEEHRAVLEALRAGDPQRARLRMAVHVLGVEDFVRAAQAAGTFRDDA